MSRSLQVGLAAVLRRVACNFVIFDPTLLSDSESSLVPYNSCKFVGLVVKPPVYAYVYIRIYITLQKSLILIAACQVQCNSFYMHNMHKKIQK